MATISKCLNQKHCGLNVNVGEDSLKDMEHIFEIEFILGIASIDILNIIAKRKFQMTSLRRRFQ